MTEPTYDTAVPFLPDAPPAVSEVPAAGAAAPVAVVLDEGGRYGLLLGDPAEQLVAWLPEPVVSHTPYRVL